jgi:hypothetical protein
MLCLDAGIPTLLAKSSTHFLDGSSGSLIPSDDDRLEQRDIQTAVEKTEMLPQFRGKCFIYYVTLT